MKHLVIALMCCVIALTVGCGQKSAAPAAEKTAAEKTVAEENIEQRQTVPHIVGKTVEYTVNGASFTGYLAYDSNIDGARPGVLVVHEWWGLNDYARNRAEQLAAMGYTAFAADMYGEGKATIHPDDAMTFMNEALSNSEAAEQRFVAAENVLKQQPTTDPEKIAAIGYCFGGGVVLNMARAGVDLDGVASFHGTLAPFITAEPGTIKAKILVLNGADDPFVPEDQVAAFKAEMDALNADYRFINYAGVKHSFTNPDATEAGRINNMPLAYDADADAKSWEELTTFLHSLFD